MFCPNCGKQIQDDVNFCPFCGAGLKAGAQNINSASHINNGYGVASIGLRFVNYLLDRIFIVIFVFIFALIGTLIFKDAALYIIVFLVFFLGYDVFFESIWQRTPAKWITKTKVVMHDGSKPDFLHILGRTLARYIPFEPFSFLFTPVGWHDSLSRTLVVPENYTEVEVKQINTRHWSATKSGVSTAVIVAVVIFVGIAILGLFSSVVLLALNSARSKARDAQRVADVRQLVTALELYYNDNNGYPASLDKLVPIYIQTLPTAPLPSDGDCKPYQNSYLYLSEGDLNGSFNYSTYSLNFCLGEITGNLSAGVHTASPEGIQ